MIGNDLQSWCWLTTFLHGVRSRYVSVSPRPMEKPKPPFPGALPGCLFLCPQGRATQPATSIHSERQIKWQQILYLLSVYFQLKFVCWYARAPASDKLLMCSLASPRQDTPNIWVLLLLSCSICLLLFATTDALSETLGGSATLGLKNQNAEGEMERQWSVHET